MSGAAALPETPGLYYLTKNYSTPVEYAYVLDTSGGWWFWNVSERPAPKSLDRETIKDICGKYGLTRYVRHYLDEWGRETDEWGNNGASN